MAQERGKVLFSSFVCLTKFSIYIEKFSIKCLALDVTLNKNNNL